ncbi:helix-turn-helix domain-containing protein [Nocardia niigatensis]|uniref:helix-turn-helix domain-containing protein n=1 Tax=Nocardia niigatensis TaxID=209249 RepID=UPI0002F35374|nr:MerR family transcriptional regulator [Nocardia niigatensis]
MDDETLYTIGALAERTGLTVTTIRFYSDKGIVPATMYSPGGYRRYDIEDVARLELVRTLRELGMDLATVRRVLSRETSLTEVATAHVEAVDVQIRVLRLRRAVANRGSDDTFTKPDDRNLREWILNRLEIANGPRVERYWHLVATINAWPALPDLTRIFDWFATALRTQLAL